MEFTDIIYTLMWLEELIPNYVLDLLELANVNIKYMNQIKRCIINGNLWELKDKKEKYHMRIMLNGFKFILMKARLIFMK